MGASDSMESTAALVSGVAAGATTSFIGALLGVRQAAVAARKGHQHAEGGEGPEGSYPLCTIPTAVERPAVTCARTKQPG
jgi:hypothetical protein